MMDRKAVLLERLSRDADGIFSYTFTNQTQNDEVQLRRRVAEELGWHDVLKRVSRSHSVPVMDREVKRFFATMPMNGHILDLGGGVGWHWRKIGEMRPDLTVVIVDLLRPYLLMAREFLGKLVDRQVFLVHGDATQLPFDDGIFDGFWTVQAFQHIPEYASAVSEAHRVLRPGGVFMNYTMRAPWSLRLAYLLRGKKLHFSGTVPGRYYFDRANPKQINTAERIFGSDVTAEYSEILFNPELRLVFAGREGSWLGAMDAHLTGRNPLLGILARQVSHRIRKANPTVDAVVPNEGKYRNTAARGDTD